MNTEVTTQLQMIIGSTTLDNALLAVAPLDGPGPAVELAVAFIVVPSSVQVTLVLLSIVATRRAIPNRSTGRVKLNCWLCPGTIPESLLLITRIGESCTR
jgi:hypothetical protein